MARKRTPTLTEAERRLMAIVWDKGEATVNDVMAALSDDYQPAYNTVLTTMRILEKKNYLQHVKEGRAHVYRPLISRDKARRQAVRHMVQSLFEDSPQLLLLNILKNEELSSDDFERLKQMVDQRDGELKWKRSSTS